MSKPLVQASLLPEAYAFALQHAGRAPAREAGYRLFWVRGRQIGWMDLAVGGAYAILGKHAGCNGVLEDHLFAQRHLLATTVQLDDGVALRLIDLRTDMPFFLHDDTARRSIVASGPMAARVGYYVVGALPIVESTRGAFGVLESTLPPPLVIDSKSLHGAQVSPAPQPAPQTFRRSARGELASPEGAGPEAQPPPVSEPGEPVISPPPQSRIVSLPPAAPISALPEQFPPTQRPGRLRAEVEPPPPAPYPASQALLPQVSDKVARVTLTRGGHGASLELTATDLDVGVVVGRIPGAHPHQTGLRAVLSTTISRGHLLLWHHAGLFEAFDLNSTQGSYVDNAQIQRFRLPASARLRLGLSEQVTLDWQRL